MINELAGAALDAPLSVFTYSGENSSVKEG